jgi:hypothetical protein
VRATGTLQVAAPGLLKPTVESAVISIKKRLGTGGSKESVTLHHATIKQQNKTTARPAGDASEPGRGCHVGHGTEEFLR